MKLSNKVLLGFLGFIFLYLTAAFTELRMRGTLNVINDKNSIAEAVDLPVIGHVVINGLDEYVWVRPSDHARLEVRSVRGGLLKNLTYRISGDTLMLSAFEPDGNQRVMITVYVSNASLQRVTVNHSAAAVDGFDQDLLHLSQDSGRITMSDNKIGKVNIDLSEGSFLNISDSNFDTVSATIDGSRVHILSPVGLVQGAMKNNAFMQLTQVKEIQLKKDEGSKLTVY